MGQTGLCIASKLHPTIVKDPVSVEELTSLMEATLSPHRSVALNVKVSPISEALKTCAMVTLSLVSPGLRRNAPESAVNDNEPWLVVPTM